MKHKSAVLLSVLFVMLHASAAANYTIETDVYTNETVNFSYDKYQRFTENVSNYFNSENMTINFSITKYQNFSIDENCPEKARFDENNNSVGDVAVCVGPGEGGYWGIEKAVIGSNTNDPFGFSNTGEFAHAHEFMHYFGIPDTYGYPSGMPKYWIDDNLMTYGIYSSDPPINEIQRDIAMFNAKRVAKYGRKSIYYIFYKGVVDFRKFRNPPETNLSVKVESNYCNAQTIWNWGDTYRHKTNITANSSGYLNFEIGSINNNLGRGLRLKCGPDNTTHWVPTPELDYCFKNNGYKPAGTCSLKCGSSNNTWCNYTSQRPTDPPEYRQVQQSNDSISPKDSINLSAEWRANFSGIEDVFLSTNETGTWENKSNYTSPLRLNSAQGTWRKTEFNWSNSSANNTHICWHLWAEDKHGDLWTSTPDKCFTVEDNENLDNPDNSGSSDNSRDDGSSFTSVPSTPFIPEGPKVSVKNNSIEISNLGGDKITLNKSKNIKSVNIEGSEVSKDYSVTIQDSSADPEGYMAYKAYNLTVKRENVEVDGLNRSINITFEVERSWLNENSISREKVVLLHKEDRKWEEKPTEIKSTGNNTVIYEASTSEFSKYAVGAEEKACVQQVTHAKSPEGECKTFSTPCEVPEKWTKVKSCSLYEQKLRAEKLIKRLPEGSEAKMGAREAFRAGNYSEAISKSLAALNDSNNAGSTEGKKEGQGIFGLVLNLLGLLLVLAVVGVSGYVGYRKYKERRLVQELNQVIEVVRHGMSSGQIRRDEEILRVIDGVEEDIEEGRFDRAADGLDRLGRKLENL
ncbi:MAG: PGF-pre-PGF domain-containing protein [Candidatus Nanohalobium sp.]